VRWPMAVPNAQGSTLTGIRRFAFIVSYSINSKSVAGQSGGRAEERQLASVDVKAILGQATEPIDLLRLVQWISKYLWFLSWDSASAKSPYFSSLLRTLAGLQGVGRTADRGATDTGRGDLGPGEGRGGVATASGSFTGLGLCMRSVLDSLWERMGGKPGLPIEGVLLNWPAGAGGGEDALEVDSRLMQLCCPLLEQARLNLQVGILCSTQPSCV
jgi:hypothetical protein